MTAYNSSPKEGAKPKPKNETERTTNRRTKMSNFPGKYALTLWQWQQIVRNRSALEARPCCAVPPRGKKPIVCYLRTIADDGTATLARKDGKADFTANFKEIAYY